METIGNRVKALREKESISQTELGEEIGLAFSSVSAIENGRSQSPDALKKIAKRFHVSPEWLINGTGEAPKGLVIPIAKGNVETPWRDEAYKALKNENERLWRLIEKITGAPAGSIANFSKVLRLAGKHKHLHLNTHAA